MVTHSSIFAWRIPWTEEPTRLQSIESQRVGHRWATNTHTHTHTHTEEMGFPGGSDRKESACNIGDPGSIHGLGRSPGEGNTHSHILAWRIHGQRSLVGCSPWGHTAELLTHFSGLKQLKLFSYSSSGQKSNTSLSGLKSRCLQDCIPSWNFRGESVPSL